LWNHRNNVGSGNNTSSALKYAVVGGAAGGYIGHIVMDKQRNA